MGEKLTYIDLFSGCGGLSLGLHNAGWNGLFAIEKSIDAFKTLEYNLINTKKHFDWPEWLPQKNHDINKVILDYSDELEKLKGTVDLVTGGPPCQGFSMAGRRNEEDQRNKLIDSYVEFVNLVRPKMLFFENVRGFTVGFKKENSRGKAYSKYVWDKLEELGYKVQGQIVDFSEFGVPQRRKRFILVGFLEGNPQDFFKKIVENKAGFLKNKNLTEDTSLEDAISDLRRKNGTRQMPEYKKFRIGKYGNAESNYQLLMRDGMGDDLIVADSHRFANHSQKTKNKFRYIIKKGEPNTNVSTEIKLRFKTSKRTVMLLDKNKQSPTLTTLPDDYIHFSEPRILTVREYARIQTFPDWFEFKGKYTTGGSKRVQEVPRYTQVGNAIPPLFGEQTGIILKDLCLRI